MSELKPCPFCGGEAEIERVGTSRFSTVYQCGYCGCTLETGETFNHGDQWNTRPDEWISVDDRLPDANVCVLVNVFRKRSHTAPEVDFICTAKSNRVTRHCGNGSPVDNRWYVFPSGGHELTGSVTHWKPLPEPPK